MFLLLPKPRLDLVAWSPSIFLTLLKICPDEVREQMLLQLEDCQTLKTKVISFTTNTVELSRGLRTKKEMSMKYEGIRDASFVGHRVTSRGTKSGWKGKGKD